MRAFVFGAVQRLLTLEFVLYDSWKFILYLCLILFLLKNFLDYEKTDVRIQILKRHKLTPHPHPPKRCSDIFRSKVDEWVVP